MSGAADIVELKDEREKRAPLKDAGFEHAGAMLKAAREAGGHSILEASDATNVRTDYLEAIEDMNTAYLPIAPYTVGFVKAYAQFLELPVEPLVARFRKEAGFEVSHIAPEVTIKAPAQLSGGRELSLLAILLIVAFVVWVAWQITKPAMDTQPVEIERTPLQQRAAAEQTGAEPEMAADLPIRAEQPETTPAVETAQAAENELELTEETAGEMNEAAAEEPETAALPQTPAAEGTEQAEAAQTPQTIQDDEPLGAGADARSDPVVDEPVSLEEPAQPAQNEALSAPDSAPVVGQPAENVFSRAETPATAFVDAVATSRISPVYPRRCERRADDLERVRLAYDINTRGRVVNERILESTNSCFDSAALSAIKRWRFDPATRNGQPAFSYDQTVSFGFQRP